MSKNQDRYQRQIRLSDIGNEGQQKLAKARVLVVGAGGLGCPLLQYLAAAGVGRIGIIDPDHVEISNLHRQILFHTHDLGKNKALAARKSLEALNPEIELISYAESLNTSNALELCAAYDIVVDGTDNFATRYLVNDACILTGKPFVYGAIFKFQGQVSVFNFMNGPTYRCVFPQPPALDSIPSCEFIGVLGIVPGIVGCMMALETLKLILELGDVLSGKMWTLDCLSNQTSVLSIEKDETGYQKVLADKDNFEYNDYAGFCGEAGATEYGLEQLQQYQDLVLVDLRENDELPAIESPRMIKVPFSTIHSRLDTLPKKGKLALFCQTGARSKKAAKILADNGFSSVYCLKENAAAISKAFSANKSNSPE